MIEEMSGVGGVEAGGEAGAGVVALLLQARPNTRSNAVRTILQNSADPHLWWGNPGLGFLDNVHRQGAGMLDIDDAILSTTRIEPAKLQQVIASIPTNLGAHDLTG